MKKICLTIVTMALGFPMLTASANTQEIEDLILQMDNQTRQMEGLSHTTPAYQELAKQVNEIAEILVLEKDNAIEQLSTYLQTHQVSDLFKNKAVEILKKIKTDKAKEVFLKGALSEKGYKYFYTVLAANGYLSMIKSPEEALVLLKSENPDVVDSALRYCVGVKIDQYLLDKLSTYLQHGQNELTAGDYYTWDRIKEIMKADPNDSYIQRKIELLSNSFMSLWSASLMEEKYPWSKGSFGDHLCIQMIDALAGMKGSQQYLGKMTDEYKGPLQECFIVARGYQGDLKVKEKIKEIVQNTDKSPVIRESALLAFRVIGDSSDIQFLKNIADNDPVMIISVGEEFYFCIGNKIINCYFPKNILPEEREFFENEKKEYILDDRRDRRYYLRPAAQMILKEIK